MPCDELLANNNRKATLLLLERQVLADAPHVMPQRARDDRLRRAGAGYWCPCAGTAEGAAS